MPRGRKVILGSGVGALIKALLSPYMYNILVENGELWMVTVLRLPALTQAKMRVHECAHCAAVHVRVLRGGLCFCFHP